MGQRALYVSNASACESRTRDLVEALAQRDTAAAEGMVRAAVVSAQKYFDEMYKA